MKKIRTPPILADIVQAALAICDGVVFDQGGICPACTGPTTGYDIAQKQFAVVEDREGRRVIRVSVKRFSCRACGRVFFADQPFYPDTRIGSPVVDLCTAFSSTMPYYGVAAYLARMGVVIDRGSVRNYAVSRHYRVATLDMFGVRLPASIVSLSSLAARLPEGRSADPSDIVAACGFPSRKKQDSN